MKRLLLGGALFGSLGFAMQAQAAGIKVGTLSCQEAAGWGFVFGSSHEVHCTFSDASGHVQRYDGSISKFGVDIGYQHSAVLIWAVIAPNNHPNPGVLAGHYGGATAGAAVGVGGGANLLVGGSDRSISLQPLSIEGETGLNVAAGIGEMTLKWHDAG
jgi:hypothetical protein